MTAPKRVVLIGHRGVGKTSLLTRIEKAYRAASRRARVFDLDREIEQSVGRSVSQIFQEDGEAVFRRLEQTTFEKLEKEIGKSSDDVFIALGAGFATSQIPPSWRAIWIRRATDEQGRIFVDRPRLNPDLDPLQEFAARAGARTEKFSERADEVLTLDEGGEDVFDLTEREFFTSSFRSIDGALTVRPENFKTHFKAWALERVNWGVCWFELRDDLLSDTEMDEAVRTIPSDRLLVSFRNPARQLSTSKLMQAFTEITHYDWPVEMSGRPSLAFEPTYLSLHERTADLPQTLERLSREGSNTGAQLKAALLVNDFRELMIGHAWQQQDPLRRIFLPMSADGRWAWYRLLRFGDYSLNFFRESLGSALDQPTLLQWVRRLKNPSPEFAAVLGDPVSHSRTPMEHAQFFSKNGQSVFAIRVSEAEAANGALLDLAKLGLRWAAVTAPLKKFAFDSVANRSIDENSRKLQAINTLTFSETGPIAGTNTDLAGLQSAAKDISKELASAKRLAVWGGGGTLDVIRAVFPSADFYSVRTGELREGGSGNFPDVLIWAGGLSKDDQGPPPSWTPKLIFDLNYSESSPARAYALSKKARYISGLSMFRAQAKAQREFWT